MRNYYRNGLDFLAKVGTRLFVTKWVLVSVLRSIGMPGVRIHTSALAPRTVGRLLTCRLLAG